MAEGAIAAVVNAFLDERIATYPWVKKHIGPPGAAGTANPAADTTRKQATFTSASGGAITTSADLEWTSVSATEDYTHCSGWSAVSGGNVGWTGQITANSVTAGDDFTLPAGDLDISMPVAS